MQLTRQGEIAGRTNQFVIGASVDSGDTQFLQLSQPAMFTDQRDTLATGDYAPATDVGTTNRYLGAFFADTLALSSEWTLSVSGRYNHARVRIADHLAGNAGVNGNFTFVRFVPAIGINYKPSAALTTYATYNEGVRAP